MTQAVRVGYHTLSHAHAHQPILHAPLFSAWPLRALTCCAAGGHSTCMGAHMRYPVSCVLQPGDLAAFETLVRQLLSNSTAGSNQAIPGALLDESALTAAAQGTAPAAVPVAAAPGFSPSTVGSGASATAAAAIPALGAAAEGDSCKVWLVATDAMGADVDVVLRLHEQLGALLLNPQVRDTGLAIEV